MKNQRQKQLNRSVDELLGITKTRKQLIIDALGCVLCGALFGLFLALQG
jgi:hypothetical protein